MVQRHRYIQKIYPTPYIALYGSPWIIKQEYKQAYECQKESKLASLNNSCPLLNSSVQNYKIRRIKVKVLLSLIEQLGDQFKSPLSSIQTLLQQL